MRVFAWIQLADFKPEAQDFAQSIPETSARNPEPSFAHACFRLFSVAAHRRHSDWGSNMVVILDGRCLP